jgi:hypothetical protein
VFSRKANTLVNLLDADLVTTDLAALLDADLYIAVSDDAINTVAAMLPLKPISTHLREYGLDVLHDNNRRGVFYPLQTFTKNKPVDFKSIPICLESETPLILDY